MDEGEVRTAIEAHARAVQQGDMDHVTSDFSEEMRPQVPELAKALPQPVRQAEVQQVGTHGDHTHATICYTGDDAAVTIDSTWAEENGRPVIVAAEPVQ